MITIYSVLKESGIQFTPIDANLIGSIVSATVPHEKDKVRQNETVNGKERTFTVNQYNDSKRSDIETLIVDYFGKKQEQEAERQAKKSEKKLAKKKLLENGK